VQTEVVWNVHKNIKRIIKCTLFKNAVFRPGMLSLALVVLKDKIAVLGSGLGLAC